MSACLPMTAVCVSTPAESQGDRNAYRAEAPVDVPSVTDTVMDSQQATPCLNLSGVVVYVPKPMET
jgi:hypothetical protein